MKRASVLAALFITGCGVMGPPVPPNSIGVNVKRENDKRLEREQALLETKADQDLPSRSQGSFDTTSHSVDTGNLQDLVPDPASRPNDDYLVRPR